MQLQLIILLFIPVMLVTLVEIYYSSKFNPGYFRFGIPGFSSRLPVRERCDLDLLVGTLSDKFRGGFWGPGLEFKKVSMNEIGFRTRMGTSHRTFSLMHGQVRFVPEENAYVVTGRFHWTALAICVALIIYCVNVLNEENRIFFLILIPLFLLFYLVEYFKYRRIATAVASTIKSPVQ